MRDADIVKLYWDRDERAIKETASIYGNYLLKIAKNILTDTEDSKECVNDTYVKAWHSMPPQKPTVLSAYLGKLIRELSIDRIRTKSRQKRGGSQYTVALEELCDVVADGDTTVSTAEVHLLAQNIGAFLHTVSPTARRIFIGRYFFLDSTRDIAAYCHISESNVKTTLHRTRKALKEHLEQEGLL